MPRSLSHDTKKCDTHVYTSFFQPLIRQKQLGNWPDTYAKRLQKLAYRTLAKRLVGQTTISRRVTYLHELPWRANFSHIFLQYVEVRLHDKQKVGSARRVTHPARSPSIKKKVRQSEHGLLARGPVFLSNKCLLNKLWFSCEGDHFTWYRFSSYKWSLNSNTFFTSQKEAITSLAVN